MCKGRIQLYSYFNTVFFFLDDVISPDYRPQCSVCLLGDAEVVLHPCQHASFCNACATAIVDGLDERRHCPVCRTNVDSFSRIYL